MDITVNFGNVTLGDYYNDNDPKIGWLTVDNAICHTIPWPNKPYFPIRVRKQTLTSEGIIVGLAPGSDINSAHYLAGFTIEGGVAHYLDCEKVTFNYACFSTVGHSQVGYVNNSNSIAHEAYILQTTPLRAIRTFSFLPSTGTKIRRVIFVGDGALFDKVILHNAVRSNVLLSDQNTKETPSWLLDSSARPLGSR